MAAAFDKETQVRRLLRTLRIETKSSTDLRDTIELLIKITRNVLPSKNGSSTDGVDPKFRQINPANTDFKTKIWKSTSARGILQLSGWVRTGEGENLRLVRDDNGEWDATDKYMSSHDLMTILVEHRNVVPLETEWIEGTKIEKVLTAEEKFRQEQLRGAEERKTEYAKALREKQERKELAENLKKEQRADQAYRNIRRPQTDGQLKAVTPGWDPSRNRSSRGHGPGPPTPSTPPANAEN